MRIDIMSQHVHGCKENLKTRNVSLAPTITSTQIAQRQRLLDFITQTRQLQFLFQSNQVYRQVSMPFRALTLLKNADLEELQ
jgi:hypothetical protein